MNKKILLFIIVFTLVLLGISGSSLNDEVYAASDNLSDAQREEFYVYSDYSYKGQDGYIVSLFEAFKIPLNTNGSYTTSTTDSSGNTYTWNAGDPLPNPCPNGKYKGKKVISMNRMFNGRFTLKILDLSAFDTSEVMDMQGMFTACHYLTDVDVTSFDTSNVTDMNGMFSACTSLSNLDLSNFNTSKVTDMRDMFLGTTKLTSINVSSFDTSKVTSMANMFNKAALSDLDLSNFNTSKVTDMSAMFAECENLTSVDVSSFDTSNVTNMYGLFGFCGKLPSVDLSNFDTSKVTDMSLMFIECSSLTRVNLLSFTLKPGVNVSGMFENAGKRVNDKPCLGIVRNKDSESVFNDGSKTGINNDNLMFNIHYSLSYDKNGGSGTLTDDKSPYMIGSKVSIKRNTFTSPKGKEFEGWNTETDGSGVSYKAGDIFEISDDITLYAQWKNIKNNDGDKDNVQSGVSDDNNSNKNDKNKDASVKSSLKKTNLKTKINTPDTSDNNSLSIWIGLTVLMSAGMIALVIYLRKKE